MLVNVEVGEHAISTMSILSSRLLKTSFTGCKSTAVSVAAFASFRARGGKISLEAQFFTDKMSCFVVSRGCVVHVVVWLQVEVKVEVVEFPVHFPQGSKLWESASGPVAPQGPFILSRKLLKEAHRTFSRPPPPRPSSTAAHPCSPRSRPRSARSPLSV